MIGLIYLGVFGGVAWGYLWLANRGVRAVFRKTGSWWLSGLAVVGFLLLPIGDTLFNRWYHRNVICKRDDVGLKIFNHVRLPAKYYDASGKFNRREWMLNKMVLEGRYQYRVGIEYDGQFPFSGYEKRYLGVFDKQENKYLSYYVDFWNEGSGWWLVPLNIIFKRFTYNGSPIYFGSGNHCVDLNDRTSSLAIADTAIFETN